MQTIAEAVPNPDLIMFLLLLSIILAVLIARALVGAICRIVKTDIENR